MEGILFITGWSTFRNTETHLLYLYRMQKYNILELTEKELPELQQIASDLGIKKMKSLEKQAVSLAGIQMEKEKEKEARKSEQKAKQATARKNRVTEKAVPPTDSDNSTQTEKVKRRPGRPRKNPIVPLLFLLKSKRPTSLKSLVGDRDVPERFRG